MPSMKAFLTLRCTACANQSFRSINAAEWHALNFHGRRAVLVVEWTGLPDGIYAGGDPL